MIFFGGDGAGVRFGGVRSKLPDGRMLIDVQPLHDGGKKFQGMELGLIREHYGSGGWNGQGELFNQPGLESQGF